MSTFYNIAKKGFLDGTIDWDTHTIKALLVKTPYTADANHLTIASVVAGAKEAAGTGYTRKALANRTVFNDTVNNRASLKASGITWTGVTIGEAAGVVIYKEATDDSDSVPILYIDSGGFPVNGNGGDIGIEWNINGILQLS
jgi:hypothetical protein